MIKNYLSVFLCLSISFTLSAKIKSKQDTTAIQTIAEEVNADSLIKEKLEDAIPTVTLEDEETNDEGGSDQAVSPVLNAGRDPFMSAASFNFGIARFKIRGYDGDYFDTYMNGIPTEYIDNGFGAFNLWAGLNDVTRNRENVLGLRPSTFAYGGIGGLYNIDSRAGKQRKQLSVTLGTSNRTYDLRGGITYGTGITKKGWSVCASLFGRWAKSGYIKGTAMQSISYFLSVQKFFKKENISLTIFGAPTKQGKAAATTQEAYDLVGSNYYNPNWGYQNGKVRNSRVEYRHQPTFILNHEWTPKDNMNLTTAFGYSFGERSLSGIDRNINVDDPRPDYYKYLPSYVSDSDETVNKDQVTEQFLLHSQVNWDRLYDVNRLPARDTTINDVNGVVGNTINGKNSVYVLADNTQYYHRFNFNTVYNVNVKKVDITAGLSYQFQKVNNYKRVKDLLGGDFYLDQNSFTEDSLSTNVSATYSDMNQPNHVVKVGDKFGYNYASVVHKTSVWAQANQHLKHIDWFAAAEFSNTTQYRVGYYKNGLNPTTSEGKSKTYSFNNFSVKGGLTYKINGRHYIYANGSYQTKAPFWDNLFISPRTRNIANDNVKSEKIGSFEGGYVFNSPKIKLRATAFFTDFKDGSNILTYFDDDYFGLASYTLTNINKRHFGGELGVEAQLYKGISASFVAAIGKYYYTSRQIGTLTIDNQPELIQQETVYSKDFYVANIPQQAYTLGLNYRSPKFWYVSANVNFFDRFYTEFAPTHRTERATNLVPYQSDQWYGIVNQERYNKKGQWTLDLSGGYSWRLKSTFRKMNGKNAGKYYLVLNTGISNLTNNKKFVVSGREQLRFDYTDKNPNKFANKYSYAFGINYYLNLTFRF
ncbi:MAG TPA: TonB-dependent receptor [Chitinophagales bacterium]|nr:TonB-dependent receptor [Chitinophagales bacterium]